MSSGPLEISEDLYTGDFEVEVSALSAEEDTDAQPFIAFPRQLVPSSMHPWRRLLAGSALLLTLLTALSVILAQAAFAPATTVAPVAAPATLLAVNSLQPNLGIAPHYCLTAPTPRPSLPGIGPVIGSAPVWVVGFDGPRATLHVSTTNTILATRYGWLTYVRLEVGPSFVGTLLVRGENLSTGAPLWFRVPNQAATSALVLDPHAPHADSPLGSAWGEWQGEISIPVAGCYSLEVAWPGGHWRLTFAAGRGDEPVIPPARYGKCQESPCIPVGLSPG